MTDLEEARQYFSKDGYAVGVTGIEIEAVGDHYAKCSLKIEDRHKNALGHVMGGVYYTLADFVFAIATNFKQSVTVTTVSQINYLCSPEGDTLYAESRLLKNGKRNCFYEIEISDNLGNKVAVVTSTGTHL